MKIICVLLSIVFVNILANITPYLRLTALTNKHIELAYEYFDDIKGNGLEYVIKAIVCENLYTMDEMNFMIAVPDKASIAANQRLAVSHQMNMQYQIIIKLGIMPELNAANLYFGNLNLPALAAWRRRFTRNALRNIIRRELIRNETERGPERVTFNQKCRFLGLWMSIIVPTLYTKSTHTGPNNDCVITDIANHITIYRSIEGKYWQVDANDINHRIIQLDEQLY
ncbi:uncharacterized protein LOC126847970 isoform X2 [Adelges cooleyi]|uniref:uncharacterized protein LOC126847970 isoform X2 n=1 Tax=Adelges cooleyi TaxID=133065 RepID=UPI00217F399B|nr:uncharacterized protein LOC126847970 isoform X2 [Adelges cooleyi]